MAVSAAVRTGVAVWGGPGATVTGPLTFHSDGAGGTIAIGQVSKSAPDGYTLLTIGPTVSTIKELFPKATVDVQRVANSQVLSRETLEPILFLLNLCQTDKKRKQSKPSLSAGIFDLLQKSSLQNTRFFGDFGVGLYCEIRC